MRTQVWIPGGLVVALFLASGCGAPKDGDEPERDVSPADAPAGGLEGTAWRLVKFEGGDGTVLTPDDPAKYTLTFEPDGRLIARIDCNRGRGTWKSSGPSSLEFGPLALTRAMCPPGSLHDHIVKQLPYVRSYVLRDGHLHLSLMADGGIYEFEPMETTEAGGGLEKTRWRLTHLDDTPVPADLAREPHLVFDPASGRASGSGGCNQISGGYRLEGDSLSLDRMIGTLMACDRGMETERTFLQNLERVRAWRIADDALELLDGNGARVARFERAPR